MVTPGAADPVEVQERLGLAVAQPHRLPFFSLCFNFFSAYPLPKKGWTGRGGSKPPKSLPRLRAFF
jgi:hypothetical protein